MSTTPILKELYAYNDWANHKLTALCEELTDGQLDKPREMGFGSLRNTLFHILEAEALWLERWQGRDWRPLVTDAGSMSVAEIAKKMKSTAAERNQLIEVELQIDFERIIEFKDSQEQPWEFPIGDLLNHVANHGIHHRAQVLSFLREFGIKIPAGIDYLFWKLAYPSCEQPSESLEPLRAYGLEVAVESGSTLAFDKTRIARYFQYGDWAMGKVFDAAATLNDEQLDREFKMGMGSLRKNLQHIVDAERWWSRNWQQENSPFPRGEDPRSINEMQSLFKDNANARTHYIDSVDETEANRIVSVSPGGPVVRFRITESMLQLCGHGTHHRAQCLNMLRQLGVNPPGLDLFLWVGGR